MTLETSGEHKFFSVGWVGSPVADDLALWQPKPPDSYTKADTIEKWINKALLDAPVLPYVSEVSEIFVLDSAGSQVFNSPSAKQFMCWALNVGGFAAMPVFGDVPRVSAIFAGFNIKQLFLLVAAEMWREGIEVPFKMWHSPPGLFDLNDLLIPGALRNGFDVGSLLAYGAVKYLPVEYQYLAGPGNAVMRTAEDRAVVARALAQFAQLI